MGAVLAIALGQAGRRVLVVDAAPAAGTRDPRSIGLTEGSRRILDQMGLWTPLAAAAAPIRQLHVSERGRFGVARIDGAAHGLEALGWMVPAAALFGTLAQALLSQPRVRVQRPLRLRALSNRQDTVVLQADAESGPLQLEAALVVGADGAESTVRDALGIAAEREDYGQTAIVTNVRFSRPNPGVAYERFTPDGPLAVLPRGGRDCGLIWMLPHARAQSLLAAEEADFLAALRAEFGMRLGSPRALEARHGFPLQRVRSLRICAERAVLAGNAAASLHPLAAQGFNLALRDVAALAEQLGPAADPGDAGLLAAYEQARRPAHDRVERFTDGLVKLFSNRLPVLSQLRALGLLGFDLLAPAQADFVRGRAGVGAHAPRAARAPGRAQRKPSWPSSAAARPV